jgi:hypothetical protein
VSSSGSEMQAKPISDPIVLREPRKNPFAAWPMRLALHSIVTIALVASVILAVSMDSWKPLLFGLLVLVGAEGAWLYFYLRR